jgi:polyhydroxyalkanoate synthesis regulator phasin
MKEVAKFYGRVNQFNQPPQPSYVTLKNAATNESVDTDAVSAELLKAEIDHAGCEFEITINQSLEGKIVSTLTKMEPKPITPERVAEIKEKFENRWPCLDSTPPPPPVETQAERLQRLEERIRTLEEKLK